MCVVVCVCVCVCVYMCVSVGVEPLKRNACMYVGIGGFLVIVGLHSLTAQSNQNHSSNHHALLCYRPKSIFYMLFDYVYICDERGNIDALDIHSGLTGYRITHLIVYEISFALQ